MSRDSSWASTSVVDRRKRANLPQPDGRRRTDLPDATITVAHVCASYGVDRKTVMKWIEARLLLARRLPSGQYRIEREALIAFHDRLQTA